MRRISRRKRRTASWFPTLGDTHAVSENIEQYRFSTFVVPWDLASTDGSPTLAIRPITLDEPRAIDISSPGLEVVDSLADVEGSSYMLDGIVGSVFHSTHAFDDTDVANNPNTPPAFLVGVGFRISEWDPHSNTPEDSLWCQPLNAENFARSKWIYRRVWAFSPTFDATLPGSWSGVEFDYNQFPSGSPAFGGYAGGEEATHIRAKSKRRVPNSDRLVVCVGVAALPIALGQRIDAYSSALGGVSVFDIRVLGHLLRTNKQRS